MCASDSWHLCFHVGYTGSYLAGCALDVLCDPESYFSECALDVLCDPDSYFVECTLDVLCDPDSYFPTHVSIA